MDFAEKNTHAMVCRFYGKETAREICARTSPFSPIHKRICITVATVSNEDTEEKMKKMPLGGAMMIPGGASPEEHPEFERKLKRVVRFKFLAQNIF